MKILSIKIGVLLFSLTPFFVLAQVTINLKGVPANTPGSEDIYVAGNFNNWNPGDINYKLKKVGSTYSIILPAKTGDAQFKFTRATWGKVECTSTGANIANRSFTYSPNLTLNLSIAGWLDLLGSGPDTASTALPNVKLLSREFFVPPSNRKAKIWVYLPNNYETDGATRYPVLYLQDGQNIFDKITSFAGEWGVDETLSLNEKLGLEACIVVAIENGGGERINEYSAYVNSGYGGGNGEAYSQFLVQSLKPVIDSTFRTESDRNNTYIGGSSMGAFLALYVAVERQETFGGALIFSPSLWFSDSIFDFIKSKPIGVFGQTTFYVMSGLNESETMAPLIDKLDLLCQTKGTNNIVFRKEIKADGAHSEWFWKREFLQGHQWLLAQNSKTQNLGRTKRFENATKISPNPANAVLEIKSFMMEKIELYNQEGIALFNEVIWPASNQYSLDVSMLKNGTYYVAIYVGGTKLTKMFLVQH
ncbi:MAG: alpha/beta hydrolase-fold protein [bacterium]|nr:alpha/beta hydrolase-fold protein [bacterium]